jgi:hypothetical protein
VLLHPPPVGLAVWARVAGLQEEVDSGGGGFSGGWFLGMIVIFYYYYAKMLCEIMSRVGSELLHTVPVKAAAEIESEQRLLMPFHKQLGFPARSSIFHIFYGLVR